MPRHLKSQMHAWLLKEECWMSETPAHNIQSTITRSCSAFHLRLRFSVSICSILHQDDPTVTNHAAGWPEHSVCEHPHNVTRALITLKQTMVQVTQFHWSCWKLLNEPVAVVSTDDSWSVQPLLGTSRLLGCKQYQQHWPSASFWKTKPYNQNTETREPNITQKSTQNVKSELIFNE